MEDEEDVSADPYLPYDGGGDTIPLQAIPKRGTPRSRLSRLRLFSPEDVGTPLSDTATTPYPVRMADMEMLKNAKCEC